MSQPYDEPLFPAAGLVVVPAPAPAAPLVFADEDATTVLYQDGFQSSPAVGEAEAVEHAEHPRPVLATSPTLDGWWSVSTTEVVRVVRQVEADDEADAVRKIDRLQGRAVGGNLAARTVHHASAIGRAPEQPPQRWLTGPRVIARARREGASSLGVYPAPAGQGWPGKFREPVDGALAEVTVELVERDGVLVVDVLVENTGGLPVQVRTAGPVNG